MLSGMHERRRDLLPFKNLRNYQFTARGRENYSI
jgi:hypothetical protein